MNPALRLQPLAVHALAFLRDLEEGLGGYLRRGARGWAHPRDVSLGTGFPVAEVLPLLHRCGLVDRDDARPPALRRPVWIYRIHDQGKCWIDAHQGYVNGRSVRELNADADASIWLAPRAQRALAELRGAAQDSRPSKLLAGEHGWRTSCQLEASARDHAEGPSPTVFDTTILETLIHAGLAERRRVTVPWRSRPIVLYRATAAGGEAIVLEWEECGLAECITHPGAREGSTG